MILLGRILKRAGLGFLIGMAVGNLIAFLSSIGHSGIVAAELVDMLGNEVAAVILQTFLSGLIGAAGFGGMLFYEIESWSMIKTMVVHFALISVVYIPVSLVLHWFETIEQFLIMEGMMLLAYMIIWLILYFVYKSQVKDLNKLQGEMLENSKK